MALPNPPEAGVSEDIVDEEEELGQLPPPDPLAMAKADARSAGKLKPKHRTVINLGMPRQGPASGAIYLRAETRERLSQIAYRMSCSYNEAIKKLATLEYVNPRGKLLGRLPGDEVPTRTVPISGKMDPDTAKKLERIAQRCHLGTARSTAARALDAILDDRVLVVGYESLEDAADALRRSPVGALREMAAQLDAIDGKILLRLSPAASRGIVAIMNEFDKRVDWRSKKTKRVIEGLADLPVKYILVGDIVRLVRSQRPITLPIWVIERLAKVGMDNMLVDRPAHRRPSTLVSETLEYVGQGAIQLIHERRGLDSIEALRRFRGGDQ